MLSRRRFVAGVASSVALGGWPSGLRAAPARIEMSEVRRRWLLAILPGEDGRFDPFAKMLVQPAVNGPVHSMIRTGDVHATQPSLVYAAALLDAGEGWRAERAQEILRVVTGLQDKDSTSGTYGLWPWCLEEPLTKTPSPDESSAGFCAMPLLMGWMGHHDTLGKELAGQVQESILHAARSIERRDADFAATTTAITDTGVTLLVAQELKLADLRVHAKDRLRRLHDYVMRQGSFAEYNSPIDTVRALQELSRMIWLVKDARDLALITPLHDLAWKHAATHFHAPTRQWAGPHSRARETDLRKQPATLAFLQSGCGGKVDFKLPAPLPANLEAYRIPLQCPRRWVKHFAQLDAPRQVVETFIKADAARPGSKNPVIGTTWLHSRLALGTVNRGDLRHEARPLLAYWGTPAAPSWLRLRFLADGVDFPAALLFSVQHESSVLAVVTFASDQAGTTTPAKSLRLRFEFGGDLSGLTTRTVEEDGKQFIIQDRDVRLVLRPVANGFGPVRFDWDSPELKMTDRIDATVSAWADTTASLASLSEAFLCFTLEEWPYEQKKTTPAAPATVERTDDKLRARWNVRGKKLTLEAPVRPGPLAQMNDAFRSSVS